MSNIYQNIQLDRIATAIENGDAGGGTLTINLTGVGDMQPATASTAGAHGLVPAPQAGDHDKFLTGAGTFESPTGGGVDYSLTEQDTGLKWIDGKKIYQTSFSFTATLAPSDWVQIGTIANIAQPISAEICTAYDNGNNWIFGSDYAKCMVDSTGGVYYYAEQMGSATSQFYITIRYTKTI